MLSKFHQIFHIMIIMIIIDSIVLDYFGGIKASIPDEIIHRIGNILSCKIDGMELNQRKSMLVVQYEREFNSKPDKNLQ